MRPKTKEEKEMQGTYEPSREAESMQLEEWDGERMPASPAGWPYPLQSFWNDRCKDLKNAGYLAKACLEPLRRYCWAVWMAREAEKSLSEEGFIIEEIGTKGQVYRVPNPSLAVLSEATKVIDKYGAKFGFSPLDVQKIPIAQKKEGKEMSLLK
jgi:P27 family predicted phage terminase small subunit